jgi:hypothetical protein
LSTDQIIIYNIVPYCTDMSRVSYVLDHGAHGQFVLSDGEHCPDKIVRLREATGGTTNVSQANENINKLNRRAERTVQLRLSESKIEHSTPFQSSEREHLSYLCMYMHVGKQYPDG